jgi:hypothetical protein
MLTSDLRQTNRTEDRFCFEGSGKLVLEKECPFENIETREPAEAGKGSTDYEALGILPEPAW